MGSCEHFTNEKENVKTPEIIQQLSTYEVAELVKSQQVSATEIILALSGRIERYASLNDH